MKNPKIFITGGTGFLGKQLALGLLKRSPEAMIWFLVRDDRRGGLAGERFAGLIKSIAREINRPTEALKDQIFMVRGELIDKNFGLSDTEFQNIARSINYIFHAAATIRFDLPFKEAYRVNVEGTRAVLALAETAHNLSGLERFHYVSTAYVAGKRTGVIYEDELDLGQKFNNTYEATKLLAEKEVRASMTRFPTTVFRPSIIMGNSITGHTDTFHVLYAPMKWGYFGKLALLPGCDQSKIDTVPIDYVTDAMVTLAHLNDKIDGQTYHLTVGQGRTIAAREMLELSIKYLSEVGDSYQLQNPRRIPRMIHPQLFKLLGFLAEQLTWGKRRRVISQLNTYTPYALFYKEFNNDKARALLEPAGIIPPRLQEYLRVLCKYAVETHFGTSDRPMHVL